MIITQLFFKTIIVLLNNTPDALAMSFFFLPNLNFDILNSDYRC